MTTISALSLISANRPQQIWPCWRDIGSTYEAHLPELESLYNELQIDVSTFLANLEADQILIMDQTGHRVVIKHYNTEPGRIQAKASLYPDAQVIASFKQLLEVTAITRYVRLDIIYYNVYTENMTYDDSLMDQLIDREIQILDDNPDDIISFNSFTYNPQIHTSIPCEPGEILIYRRE